MVLHGCELSCCRWHGKSTVCGGTRSKGRFVRIARVLVSVGDMICIAVNMDIGRGRLKPSVEWRLGSSTFSGGVGGRFASIRESRLFRVIRRASQFPSLTGPRRFQHFKITKITRRILGCQIIVLTRSIFCIVFEARRIQGRSGVRSCQEEPTYTKINCQSLELQLLTVEHANAV